MEQLMGINGETLLAAHPFWNINVHELFTNWPWIDCLNKGWTRVEQGLNKGCSEIVQKLMRQLMGINGETLLAGSAPSKN